MDFGSISGRSTKSSMKRKSLLGAFRKSTNSSNPPTSYIPPASATSSSLPAEPDSPYAETASSNSHDASSQRHYPNHFHHQHSYSHSSSHPSEHHSTSPPSAAGSASASSKRYAESSMSGQTASTATAASDFHAPFGRGGAGRKRTTSSGKTSLSAGPLVAGVRGKDKDRDRDKDRLREVLENKDREKSGNLPGGVKRPEDMVKVVRDRLFSWSYMMQWYQGDTHWFNTVKIPRSTTESYLGPKQLESRSQNFFILGMSLAILLDTGNAVEYLRSVNKVLDEWEVMIEGGNKVDYIHVWVGVYVPLLTDQRGLFRGPKANRKISSSSGGEYIAQQEGDSVLMHVNLPFTPDFFQIHATTCSLIRDLYKKILRLFLPSRPPTSSWIPPKLDPDSLVHPGTLIHAAPLDNPFPPMPTSNHSRPPSQGGPGASGVGSSAAGHSVRSPSIRSTSSASHSNSHGHEGNAQVHPRGNEPSNMGMGDEIRDEGLLSDPTYDAFQAYILGELPNDRTLVGEGQAMTKDVVELFAKVDAKLRKYLSFLIRETDSLARKVLDDELSSLSSSLNPGMKPMSFDYSAAASTTGNGFTPTSQAPTSGVPSSYSMRNGRSGSGSGSGSVRHPSHSGSMYASSYTSPSPAPHTGSLSPGSAGSQGLSGANAFGLHPLGTSAGYGYQSHQSGHYASGTRSRTGSAGTNTNAGTSLSNTPIMATRPVPPPIDTPSSHAVYDGHDR